MSKQNRVLLMFRKYFINFFWIGLVVVLGTIIYEKCNNPLDFIQSIVIDTLSTIGISLLVASFFSWASDTISFMDKIQELLKAIVIKRDFLSNLDNENKQNALRLLIKPSETERNIYANIEDYYSFYIKKTMNIINKNVRSDYSIEAKVFFDKQNNLVACEDVTTYRLYPNDKGFGTVKVGFLGSEKLNSVEYIYIYKPEGNRLEFKQDKLIYKEVPFGGMPSRMVEIDINEHVKDEKHLRIEIKTIEYGDDHWISIPFQALQPTDGIHYRLNCEDGFHIVKCETYGQGIDFNIDENPDKTEISISTYQWINDGTGLNVIVSNTKKI